jgi:iron complex outermembrane receptor protein
MSLKALESRDLVRLTSVLLALALPAIGVPVIASADNASSDSALEEIVVNAFKQGDQSLQNIPASVAVVSGDELEKIGAVEFADFSRLVAGLNFVDNGPGNKRYIIRGINSAGEAQTALYYDNIPVTGMGASATDFGGNQPDLELFDMQRVEVLRGPQGTLYGQNSQAGVVRIVTKKPDLNDFGGEVQSDVSDTKDGGVNYSVKGVVNLPVSTGVFAVRLVGYDDNNSGFIDDPLRQKSEINSSEQSGGRISAALQIDPSTSLLGQVFYQHLAGSGLPTERPYDMSILGVDYPAVGQRAISLYTQQPFDDKSKVYALTLDHDFGWSALTVATSLFDRDLMQVQDYTTSFNYFRSLQALGEFPPGAVPQGGAYLAPQSSQLWSGEARLSTKLDGSVNGVVGVYYDHRTIDYLNNVVGSDPDSGAPDPSVGEISSRTFEDRTKDFALFSEVTDKLTDRLSFTGGLRWFDTIRDLTSATIYPFFGIGSAGPDQPESGKNTGFLKKALFDYHLTRDAMVYVSYSEGYRAGGTNAATVAAVPAEYAPDRTRNYEIGGKTSWLDNRLTADVAVFVIDLVNMQVPECYGAGCAFSGVGNVPGTAARATGTELDVAMRPLHNWSIDLAASYIRAVLVEDLTADLGSTATDGAPLQNVPKVNASLSTDYEWPVGPTYKASVGGSLQYVGRVDVTSYDDDGSGVNIPASPYALLNLRAGLDWERYKLTLYINNALDKNAQLNVYNDVNDAYVILTNRPRTIGLRLSAQF